MNLHIDEAQYAEAWHAERIGQPHAGRLPKNEHPCGNSGRKRFVDLDVAAISKQLSDGRTVEQIAAELDMPRSTLSNRLRQLGVIAPKNGSQGVAPPPADKLPSLEDRIMTPQAWVTLRTIADRTRIPGGICLIGHLPDTTHGKDASRLWAMSSIGLVDLDESRAGIIRKMSLTAKGWAKVGGAPLWLEVLK